MPNQLYYVQNTTNLGDAVNPAIFQDVIISFDKRLWLTELPSELGRQLQRAMNWKLLSDLTTAQQLSRVT